MEKSLLATIFRLRFYKRNKQCIAIPYHEMKVRHELRLLEKIHVIVAWNSVHCCRVYFCRCACYRAPRWNCCLQQCSLKAPVIKFWAGWTEGLLPANIHFNKNDKSITLTKVKVTLTRIKASSILSKASIMQNMTESQLIFDKIVSVGCPSHQNCFCFKLYFTPSHHLLLADW